MPGGKTKHGHPEVWAFLTIITLPIVLITTDLLGCKGLWPFAYALLATFGVLVLEAVVRGKLWPFEEGFIDHIGHPATPFRILLILGATLLILETALIFAVATDRRFDLPLLSLVVKKQCAARYDSLSNQICSFLVEPRAAISSQTTTGDRLSYALRNYAAKTWYPNEALVTCTERKVTPSLNTAETSQYASLIHCTAWKLDEAGGLLAKASQTVVAGAKLKKQADGFYTTVSVSDNPNSPTWENTLGELSEKARDKVFSIAILPDLVTVLQAEAQGRAQGLMKQ